MQNHHQHNTAQNRFAFPGLTSNFEIPQLLSPRPQPRGKNSSRNQPKSRGFFQKKGGAWLGGKNLPHFRLSFTEFFPLKPLAARRTAPTAVAFSSSLP